MNLLTSRTGGRGSDLTDGDLVQILDAFRRSGRGSLDLRLGPTRLSLGLPKPQGGGVADPQYDVTLQTVTAPFVGVFATDVTLGQAVSAGMVLGRIRSVMAEREVRATDAGTITARLVADGSFVAFGDPLFGIATPQPDQGQRP